ncbi:1,2-dihydroxy-3-keto-5-methylthiopentene dioxygenase [Acidisoma cladoniae]|jgi:1,2-dihydroxy-3-keto-5-methylthiopentene dioxygenase|uniref:1,2-dihydroxy-3-keto-5-methylthiopentene dioxygenase n=1 Tax=Acidisoma cladoniae TaxID=3040935 RepID=UPI00254E86C9|nr:acireductone dioxygenase [Acidisoma sp. PAMC 29798]
MSRLTIYNDDAPDSAVLRAEDVDTITRELNAIGVRFERWESPVVLSPDDDAETILAAYRPYLDGLMGSSGAGSADVIKLTPDNPAGPTLRAKFINEHSHTEDEIRFFVHGSGNFILHLDGRIYDAHCTAGDLISVPANIRHWFDAGERPFFTALRVFTDTSGWVPHFTGDDISARFPAA